MADVDKELEDMIVHSSDHPENQPLTMGEFMDMMEELDIAEFPSRKNHAGEGQ
jgi:hypothetical protein